ncbi:LPXTG cell wall anchor domain-containing protein, partial [Gracilibacillus alcaliphilus]|uniref:LPXTG cell wall anchor domain-containing protein n=1 Tax=Gracilibacillus alcaliphilus TaxID=1401441 RepID=UPI00195DB4E9
VLVAEATYTITQADVDAGQVANHATVTGHDPNEEPVTDEDEALVPHTPNPAISLEKTSDVEEVTEAGQVVTYAFEVTNTGDVTLTDIVVDDPRIDGAIELETTTLAPGETTTGTAEYTVTEADLDNEGINNVATVSGLSPEDELVEDEDNDWIPVKLSKPEDLDNPGKTEDVVGQPSTDQPGDTGTGSGLPNTATNTFNLLWIGLAVLILGGTAMIVAKRRKES